MAGPVSRRVRFTFIVFLAALSTTLAAVGGWRYARASAPVSGPIILISIDTLRADHLPAYGYRNVKTPAIDALAADGVVFDRAYSHAPLTLPAHAALLSGQLPFETGVRDDTGFALRPGERLLPQMLRDRGFTTAGIVSSDLLRKETGIGQGFDLFDAEMPMEAAEPATSELQRDGAESEAIAEQWLQSIGTSRAFLFLHLNEPHKPYAPPARFADYDPYDGEIAYADEIVGRLVRYLKSHQLYDRSTVVLVSDHGEGLGDHGEQEHGLFVYDEAIHVPLVIKQESNAGAGRRVADLVQHIDLVPTILDLVKAPVPGGLRGRSLKGLLDGTGRLPAAAVYSEAFYARHQFGWSELTAITGERYRYIHAPHEELYDLQQDARERANLAAARPQARQTLRTALDRLTAGAAIQPPQTPAATIGTDPKEKRDVVERYRAAIDLASERRWASAIALLHQIVKDDPELTSAWRQLAAAASRIERHDVAVEAYGHVTAAEPDDWSAYLGAAASLLKLRRLDEARDHAHLAADVAAPSDRHARASAHEMLARIALARRDDDAARAEASLARDADPLLPFPSYIEGRLLYDRGRYEDATTAFADAIAALKKPGSPRIADLHFYAGEALVRLERYDEAQVELLEELRQFPQNTRARAALATAYQACGQADEAERALQDLTRITPTPESYALAARMYLALGDRRQADAMRAAGRRAREIKN
ncbi:MAG: hypothetical protein DMF93_01055 [Acidobacteria bacterium]|nr:MAG: hypothetical protein DMF93_01055 [Acidobacteriota bacterium]